MNEQEIYDKSVAGLASQGFRRSVRTGYCMYRDGSGRKCAVGWLIDDVNYNPIMEGYSVDVAIRRDFLPGLKFVDRAFLADLQNAHDTAISAVEMKSKLREVGENYGLKIPDVLKYKG